MLPYAKSPQKEVLLGAQTGPNQIHKESWRIRLCSAECRATKRVNKKEIKLASLLTVFLNVFNCRTSTPAGLCQRNSSGMRIFLALLALRSTFLHSAPVLTSIAMPHILTRISMSQAADCGVAAVYMNCNGVGIARPLSCQQKIAKIQWRLQLQ